MAGNPLVDAIKAKLDALEPEKRQKVIKGSILGAGALFFIGMYYATGQEDKKPPPPKEAASVIELGDARLEDDIRAQVQKEREEQDSQNKNQDVKIKEQEERIAQQDAQLKAMQGVLATMSSGPAMGLPDLQPREGGPSSDPLDWQNGMPADPSGGTAPVNYGSPGQPVAGQPAPVPIVAEYVGTVGNEKGSSSKPAGEGGAGQGAKKKRFYLPPSFMPAKLLTGLAAKTVEGAKTDPEPMMLRVQAPAVLPNEVRAQLEGCLVVGHGFGSLASERVEAQLVSISCLDFEGKSMIDAELRGIVVDKDGVKGLAGHPVSKMGTNLARLAFAGAIQGAGAAFAQTATTQSVSPLGQTQTIDPSQVGRAGAGRGVESAAEEYARIIADLVRQQSPVIEVGPSKDVTVVVTEGAWLEVKSYEEGNHE